MLSEKYSLLSPICIDFFTNYEGFTTCWKLLPAREDAFAKDFIKRILNPEFKNKYDKELQAKLRKRYRWMCRRSVKLHKFDIVYDLIQHVSFYSGVNERGLFYFD